MSGTNNPHHRAIVTGGASGIGAEVVRLLLEAHYEVAVLDLPSQLPLMEGWNVHSIAFDLSSPETIATAVDAAWNVLGDFDRGILCAGVGGSTPIRHLDLTEWERVVAINLTGTYLTLRALLSPMVDAHQAGSVVTISSTSGQLVERGFAHYGASKAGLNHLVRIAAAEYGAANIRVNAIAPGVTHTPMFEPTKSLPGYWSQLERRTPLKRIGTPRDIAEAVLAVLELGWVTGQVLTVDGGLSLFSPVDFTEIEVITETDP